MNNKLIDDFSRIAFKTASAYRKRLRYFRWLDLDDLINSVWVELLTRQKQILINGVFQDGLAAKLGYNAAFMALRQAYDGPNAEFENTQKLLETSRQAEQQGETQQWAAEKLNMDFEFFQKSLTYALFPRFMNIEDLVLYNIQQLAKSDHGLDQAVNSAKLNKCLAALTNTEIEAITMVYFQGHSVTEAARIKGHNAHQSIWSAVERGKQRLRLAFDR